LRLVDHVDVMCPGASQPHDELALASQEAAAPEVSVSQLAHELNSLLDGSIRCVAQALRSLEAAGGPAVLTPDVVAVKLRHAREAMRQMAELLDRARAGDAAVATLFDQRIPLAQGVPRLIAVHRELADAGGVRVKVTIAAAVRPLPIGPLGPVIANGLRNAIEACAAPGVSPRRVEVAVTSESGRELVIAIRDTGDGVPSDLRRGETTKPQGRGLGLALSQQIVGDLGGTLHLSNAPQGGAIFEARIPLERMSLR
jgi:C4-dicarboxylate-specific signal transduction histidine kinase